MNKKGIELTLSTIVIAIMVLVVLAVMLIIFSALTNKSGGSLFCYANALGADTDTDNAKDIADPCPCDGAIPKDCTGSLKDQPKGCPGSPDSKCPTEKCDICKKK